MSNLANQTETKAIKAMANALKEFDKLTGLNMTHIDAESSKRAENTIRGIIESNGYEVIYKPGKGTRIKKVK